MNTHHLLPALALSLVASLPALACKDCDDKAAAQASTTTPSEADALSVVRDAETGRLRAPTPAEHSALQAQAQQRRLAAESVRIGGRAPEPTTPLLRSHATGARSVRLTADFSSYTVAVRQADGSLDQRCVEGAEAADKLMKTAAAARSTARSTALETQ